jgi:hypothetical protein
MPPCDCASFEDMQLTRDAVDHRARQTKSLKQRLQLEAKHPDDEHLLFTCTECGQTWQRSLAWNWGNKEYLFRVPPIDTKEWVNVPFVQPDELVIFAAVLARYLSRGCSTPTGQQCRRDGCPNSAVKLSLFCVRHHIENLQRIHTFPQSPVGRWFGPYRAEDFAVPS